MVIENSLTLQTWNFEIRVRQNADNLGYNLICYQQFQAKANGLTTNFTCLQALYASWVSVNKSDTKAVVEYLELHEERIFVVHRFELILSC